MGISINFDQKQRINLSAAALDVIQLDSSCFADGMNRTGFINELLSRCAGESTASIDLAKDRYKSRIEKTLKSALSEKDLSSALMQKGLRALEDDYKDALTKKALSWPKGESVLFRLSNDNCRAFYGDTWDGAGEDPLYPLPECYGGKVSKYLKAILEEYASKTMYEREGLYFHSELSLIRMAMETEKLVRLTSSNPSGKKISWDVRVYGIFPDDSGLYRYIVGMTAPSSGAKKQEHIASLRLSRIRDVRILDGSSARSGHLAVREKRMIEERMAQSRVQFLASGGDDIVVRFTPEGLSMYHQILYMRPKIDYTDEEGNCHFSCSTRQAEFYFQKFGAQAKVLEPKELCERLSQFYQKAEEAYGSIGE